MLTATNIDRGFNSVTSVFTFNLHTKNFCTLKSKIFTGHQKKSYARTEAFTTTLIMGKLNLSSRQQVPRLQDKAEWLFYILYFGGTVVQFAIRQ